MEQLRIVLQKHNDLHHLAEVLGCPEETDKAERIFRAILHTLRNGLKLEEAITLLRLLPKTLKPIYIENWYASDPVTNWLFPSLFIKAVRDFAGKIAFYDFPSEPQTVQYIRAVFGYIEADMTSSKKRILHHLIPFSLLPFTESALPVKPFTTVYKGNDKEL